MSFTKSIGFVISYCELEEIFIETLIKEASKITKTICIVYSDTFFDMTPQNTDFIENHIKNNYPYISLVKYEVKITSDIDLNKYKRPTAYWNNLARKKGFDSICHQTEFIFFVDGDEIPDGNHLLDCFNKNYIFLDPNTIYSFANFWYFKLPIYQALTLEDSILFIHKKFLHDEDIFFNDNERHGMIKKYHASHQRMIIHDNLPCFHHYSWVRNKNAMKKKLENSAHLHDVFKGIQIDSFINKIFENDQVNDIVHHYRYKVVDNNFNIQV